MKFCLAKNDNLFCFSDECGSKITAGIPYVMVFNRQGRPLLFHVDCYRKWADNYIVGAYFKWKSGEVSTKLKHRPKKTIGRPHKYKGGVKAARIRALIYYYKKRGNMEEVTELEEQLMNLKISEPVTGFSVEPVKEFTDGSITGQS